MSVSADCRWELKGWLRDSIGGPRWLKWVKREAVAPQACDPTSEPCARTRDGTDHLFVGRTMRPGRWLELSLRRPGASARGLGRQQASVPDSQRPKRRRRLCQRPTKAAWRIGCSL